MINDSEKHSRNSLGLKVIERGSTFNRTICHNSLPQLFFQFQKCIMGQNK